jgi:hypothetical protein
MSSPRDVKEDLSYVRSALDRAEAGDAPPSIYLLWAVVGGVGLSLMGPRPEWAAFYWPIAGPAGGVISYWLGHRWARRVGQGSRRIARYHALHWIGVLGAIGLAVALGAGGLLGGEALGRVILLILALGWYLAGIYLVRRYMWIGLVVAAGLVTMMLVPGFGWVFFGAIFAASLLLAAAGGPWRVRTTEE